MIGKKINMEYKTYEGVFKMWEIYHLIQQAELTPGDGQELVLHCLVPTSAEHFKKLLDGATQAALGFDGGSVDGQSLIGFQLRNANGEFYLALPKKDWELLLEQPDEIVFHYGTGEKERFSATFLNGLFEGFLDQVIDRYNRGEKDPFTTDIIAVFAEEEEA